jgi:Phosphotransferase enzyme family
MTAGQVVDLIHEAHGLRFSLDGRCPGGEVGAHYARSPDGTRFVFKWSEDADDLAYFASVVDRVTRLRAAGYPAPRYLPPFSIDGGVALFQDAVPGRWRDDVGDDLVSTVLGLNDLQAGRGDSGDAWTSYIRLTLTEGADGYCLHEPMRQHSPATRRIVQWVEGVGATLGPLPEEDLVHIDFHHRNMLRDGDEFVAVVDWEGCRPGDRAFDLVTFCFGMSHANAEPGVFDPVWRRAAELTTPDALAAYVAHMALRRLDWTVRNHPDELERVMAASLRCIGRVRRGLSL